MEHQFEMFGTTVDAMRKSAGGYPGTKSILAMSILSDAQELLAQGDSETARQFMNRAKFIISEYLADK